MLIRPVKVITQFPSAVRLTVDLSVTVIALLLTGTELSALFAALLDLSRHEVEECRRGCRTGCCGSGSLKHYRKRVEVNSSA
jgi:hypothetical protein